MKSLRLITEGMQECELVKEAYDPTKPQTIKVQGVYAVADVRNGNNRIYKYDVLKPEIDKFIKEKIETGTAFEELEHPECCTVNPKNVCARTLSLEEDNKSWVGTSVIMASDPKFGIRGTVNGDIVAGILSYGGKMGHSTRALGNVDESTGSVSDLQLVCIDLVGSPSIGIFNNSNANRFVNGILESKQFVINTHGEILEEKFENFEKSISKMPNTNIGSKKAEFLGNAITEFFESLTK